MTICSSAVHYEKAASTPLRWVCVPITGCRLARAVRMQRCCVAKPLVPCIIFGEHSSQHINRTAYRSRGLTALSFATCNASAHFQELQLF